MIRTPDACACCRYLTLGTRKGVKRCPVCFWQEDGQGGEDACTVRGTNGLSLAAARANFRNLGACEPRFVARVRSPQKGELPRA